MFAKFLMGKSIRPACTGILAMYNALRYSLHVCYNHMLHSGLKSLILDTWLQTFSAMIHDKISKKVWNYEIYPPVSTILHTSCSLQ